MVRQTKVRPYRYKPPKKLVPKDKRTVTPLIYYGGKSRDAEWIVSHFPPHNTFVDVFGGGAAVLFKKLPSKTDIYNDIGNVCNFFRVLRDHGEELYDRLYLTPFSREEHEYCIRMWKNLSNQAINNVTLMDASDKVEWARCWYIHIIQGYIHSENDSSWKVTKSNDIANSFNERINELPRFVERLKGVVIENYDFMEVLNIYDSYDTLFYLDPPYTKKSRSAYGQYRHEMDDDRHKEMLAWLTTKLKGQAVVSMYPEPYYEEYLSGWLRSSKTRKGSILNSLSSGSEREEVVWVKEHSHGLWSSPDVPRIQEQEL